MASTRLTTRRAVRRSVAVLGAGALVVSLTSCKPTPDQEVFYTAPDCATGAFVAVSDW